METIKVSQNDLMVERHQTKCCLIVFPLFLGTLLLFSGWTVLSSKVLKCENIAQIQHVMTDHMVLFELGIPSPQRVWIMNFVSTS